MWMLNCTICSNCNCEEQRRCKDCNFRCFDYFHKWPENWHYTNTPVNDTKETERGQLCTASDQEVMNSRVHQIVKRLKSQKKRVNKNKRKWTEQVRCYKTWRQEETAHSKRKSSWFQKDMISKALSLSSMFTPKKKKN